MVRESRHLWVGNLPENAREEQIQDYFSRYGRVEKVKLLPKTSPDGGRAAFVDFVDIRSATKANEAPNRMGERDLRTNYNEPGKTPDYGRGGQSMHRIHGGYPPAGMEYRGQPVVIYAAPPPADHVIHAAPYRAMYSRDDRRPPPTYQPRRERGRSPASRGSFSDGEPSPKSRSRVGEYSSDSDDSKKNSNRATVLVKNLSSRTPDSNLEEELYHEFKKYGEILNINIKGEGLHRHAYVKFMKTDEAEEACHSSGKLFLGQEIKVLLKGHRSRRSMQEELSFDPHATRTVFVGNLEKTMMHGELRNIFERFGDVVDVDIKKMQTGVTTYSFVQYIDINGAMLAKRKMDRQYIGENRVKVGYGRGTPTNSLWVGNLQSNASESQISKAFHPFGYVQRCLLDKKFGQALVRFETIESCTRAFAEMHGKLFLGKRLAVDYASPACRDGFYSRMEKNGLLDRRQLEPSPTPPDAHMNFQNVARGGPFHPRGVYGARTYDAPTFVQREKDYGDYRDDKYATKRDYSYGRDKYRDIQRSHSPLSRESISPKRRISRESISPVSSSGFYSGGKPVRVEKEKRKKRKRSIAEPQVSEEPSKKKEKKKKKDKKEKQKKVKATQGTFDLGYSINEQEEEPAALPEAPKTKSELKKEKKEKRKVEKAEKARKKAEKKERKLKKLQSMEDTANAVNSEVKSEKADQPSETPLPGTIEHKTHLEIKAEETGNTPDETASLPVEEFELVKPKTEEISEGEGIVEEKTVKVEHVNGDVKTESTEDESKPVVDKISEDNAQEKQCSEAKPSASDIKPNEMSGNEAKSLSPSKEVTVPLEKAPATTSMKDSSDSSSSSSSSSSESEDSDDSSDEEDKSKQRVYRTNSKDDKRSSLPPVERDAKNREPKAYRAEGRSEKSYNDYRHDRSRERSRESYREREYARSKYPENRRSPPPSFRSLAKDRLDQSKPSGIGVRSRSRSPYSKRENSYDRRRGRSPGHRSPQYDRRGLERSSRRLSPPPPPPGKDSRDQSSNRNNGPHQGEIVSSGGSGGGQSTDTLLDLLRRFPVMWQGLLGLKNDTAAVQMHFLSGSVRIAEASLPRAAQPNEVPPPLRISQRMKLEPSQLEGVDKRISQPKEHCMLLALPCGRDPLDVHAQTRALKTGFITYLQQKQAAGIINVPTPPNVMPGYVVHIFPPCDFAQRHLAHVAPDLLDSAADSGHLMVLITPA